MPEHDQIYPQATRELAEQRKPLAPGPAEAFRAFSQRAGGAYAHSAFALDTIARFPAEKAT